jgi:GntR family transcriptional regulator
MQIQINNASDRPVYQQIIDHIKRDIALDRLKCGEKLPTVRRLAAQIAINPNTIAKAYRQLEQEGIIVTRPGTGAFVTDANTTLSLSVRRKIICEDIERLIVEAIHMQIDREVLVRWFGERIEKFKFADKGDKL